MMVSVLLVLNVCAPFATMVGLTVWALGRRKREGTWRWPSLIALVIAGLLSLVTASFWISAFGDFAHADAASRATILARAISSALNAGGFACFAVCLVAPLVLAYRYFIAKAQHPEVNSHVALTPRELLRGLCVQAAMLRCALLLAFTASLTLTPSLALASAAPWPVIHEQDPMPTIAVEGDLQVTRGQITISCGLGEFVDVWATCTIEASLRVSTDAGARLTREPLPTAAVSSEPDRMAHVTVIADRHPEDEVLLGGRPFVGTLALAPGMTRTLTVRATRELRASFQTNDYLLFSAPITRHLFLSESHAYRFHGERRESQLLRGDFTITGPVQLDARNTAGIEVKLGEQRMSGVRALPLGAEPIAFSLNLDRERDHDGPVANGGLVIHGATRENLDVEDEGRALVALEYAFIIEEFVFVSAGLATDFQSAFQSLVVEVATPDLIFMIPSLSAGLGVVVRELGDRPTDAALRARLSASWPVLGVNVDLDYWPDLGQWTSTLGLRIGL